MCASSQLMRRSAARLLLPISARNRLCRRIVKTANVPKARNTNGNTKYISVWEYNRTEL